VPSRSPPKAGRSCLPPTSWWRPIPRSATCLICTASKRPYRTYVLAMLVPRDTIEDALYWDTLDPYHYVRLTRGPDKTDYLLVGGTDHKSGEADDAEVRYEALEAWMRARLPKLGRTTHRWSGQVLDPIDYAAFSGRNPGNEHVFVHTGDSGQGLTHGVLGSLLISRLIASGNADWEEFYAPARTARAMARSSRPMARCRTARLFLRSKKPERFPVRRRPRNPAQRRMRVRTEPCSVWHVSANRKFVALGEALCVSNGVAFLVDPQKALSYQRALAAFTRIVSEADSEARLLQNAAAQVARVTHIRHVKVLRYRPDRGDLLIEAGVGWKPGVVGNVSFGADRHSSPGRSLQTGAPVACEDIRHDPEFRYADVLREHDIISVLNVPVFVDGKHWGVLEVDAIEKTAFEEFDIHALCVFADIIGLSLAQRAVQADTAKAAAEITSSRAQTEILLRELQHRMKNNLQVIVSFLALQSRQSSSEEARERIASVMDRVLAIGLAHDQLSFKNSVSSVDMHDYLKALCANIDPRRPQVSIEVDVDAADIPLDRAVPIGLIVNELVTNSVKYAFDEEGGVINVAFRVDETIGEAQLSVSDNGRGMGPARKGAFGLRLVESLAGQLGGRSASPAVPNGTLTILRFPYSV
jgi:two-component sensor histidine kinase/putative methionine-R-sulfoxide reductase with GAF domain